MPVPGTPESGPDWAGGGAVLIPEPDFTGSVLQVSCRDGGGHNNEWPLPSKSDIHESAVSPKVKPYVRQVCTCRFNR